MDFSKRAFRNLVNQSNKMIESWYSQKIRGEKIYENKTPSEIKKVFSLEEKNKQCKPEDVLSHLDKNLLKYLSTAPVLLTAWMSLTAGAIIEAQRFMPDTLSFASY